nr:MAG TPA: hypothetical protein [Caudoviricetes sp.]
MRIFLFKILMIFDIYYIYDTMNSLEKEALC